MRKFLLFGLVLFAFSIISVSSYAQVFPTNCFSYYDFQNGLVYGDFHTGKTIYNAGDTVTLTYSLTSNMHAPIAQGSVLMRVYYVDNGVENAIGDFVSSKDVNLLYGASTNEMFSWKIPSDAKAGQYEIKSFFMTSDRFNLAGINFVDSIPGTSTTFQVQNSGSFDYIHFGKSATTINGNNYDFTGYAPSYDTNTTYDIRSSLVSDSGSSSSVPLSVTIKTYRWDDSLPTNEITDLEKTFTPNLSPGSKQDLDYQIGTLSPDAYLVTFVAKDQNGNTVSLVKIRFAVQGLKGRFNYLGLDKFPLNPGQPVTGYFCLSNAADYFTSFNGTGYVEILDQNRNSIFKENFGPIEVSPSPPQGWAVNFTPTATYTKVYERALLYDDSGKLLDSAEAQYDYSLFAGVNSTFAVSADSASPGGSLKYTVQYKDQNGLLLSGDFVVYLVDNSNNIVASDNSTVSGTYSGSLAIPSSLAVGTYTLKAQETQFNLNDSTQVQIQNSNFLLYVSVGIVVVLVIAVVLWKFARRS